MLRSILMTDNTTENSVLSHEKDGIFGDKGNVAIVGEVQGLGVANLSRSVVSQVLSSNDTNKFQVRIIDTRLTFQHLEDEDYIDYYVDSLTYNENFFEKSADVLKETYKEALYRKLQKEKNPEKTLPELLIIISESGFFLTGDSDDSELSAEDKKEVKKAKDLIFNIAKIAKESDSHVILTSNYYDTQNIKSYIEDDFNIIHVDDENKEG